MSSLIKIGSGGSGVPLRSYQLQTMEEADEEDPLDAFMATIDKQIIDQQQDTADHHINQGATFTIIYYGYKYYVQV